MAWQADRETQKLEVEATFQRVILLKAGNFWVDFYKITRESDDRREREIPAHQNIVSPSIVSPPVIHRRIWWSDCLKIVRGVRLGPDHLK